MTVCAVILLAILLISSGVEAQSSGIPCLKLERGDSFDCVCNDNYCDTIHLPETLQPRSFYSYSSSAAADRFHLRLTTPEDFANTETDATLTVALGNVSQEILGFGGALTDATGYNLNNLPSKARDKFMDSYFSKEGIEYSFVRVPIGGTDFSLEHYTNLNTDGEFVMREEDPIYKIPYIKDILKRNPNVRLLGSSWVAPEWMLREDKFGRKIISPDHYRSWAEYHKSFFDLYKCHGIDFWGATTGNEIVLGIFSVPWSMEEHQTWINEHLGPVLEQSGYGDLKLLFLDDQTSYMFPWLSILFNNVTSKYVDGVAIHWYLDEKIYLFLNAFHDIFPSKLILNTEASICKYEEYYEEKLQWYGAELYAENIISKMNLATNGWIDWNLALDLEGGPNYRNNTCTAAVIVNAERGEFYKGPIFYAMGHFSKFVPPGSKRVGSSMNPVSRDLLAAAFTVEDRPWNVAVVLLNKRRKKVSVRICIDDGYCGIVHMPARSVVSTIAKVPEENQE